MTVYQRDSGIYYVSFYDQHRKPQQKRISLKTRNEEVAHEKAKDLEMKYAKGEWDPWKGKVNQDLSIWEGCVRVLEGRYASQADSTYRSRQNRFKRFAEHVGEDRKARFISHKEVRRFLEKYDGRTLRTIYSQIQTLFNSMEKRDIISDNPFDKISAPRISQSEKKVTFTDKEYNRLLEAIEPTNPWLATLMRIGYHTGMRQGEIRNLPWANVDLKAQTIHIENRTDWKTKNRKDRIVPIPDVLVEILREWKKDFLDHPRSLKSFSERWVLVDQKGDRASTHAAITSFRRWREKLGIRDELTLHTLRHTFATRMVRNGMPIHILKDILGHSSVETTMMYAHNNVTDLSAALEDVYSDE